MNFRSKYMRFYRFVTYHKIPIKLSILLGFTIIVVLYLPMLIKGTSSQVLVHDNFDPFISLLALRKSAGNLFVISPNEIIPNIMNGLQVGLVNYFGIIEKCILYIFPIYWGYIIYSIFLRVIGLIGILLLSKDYYNKSNLITLLIAVSFAALPIFPTTGLSVMAYPILFWAFLNLEYKKTIWLSLLLITITPIECYFAYSFPFFHIFFGIYALYRLFYYKYSFIKQMNVYIIGMVLMFLSFIFSNYQLLFAYFFSNTIYHRVEFVNHLPSGTKFELFFRYFFDYLINSHYHFSRTFSLPIVILAIICLVTPFKSIKKTNLYALLIVLIVSSIISTVCLVNMNTINKILPFDFSRVYQYNVFLYYLIILNVSMRFKLRSKRLRTSFLSIIIIVIALTSYQTTINGKASEIGVNIRALFHGRRYYPLCRQYNEFTAEGLFQQVEEYIGRPKDSYSVVSVFGLLNPAVTQINGFNTLDGYINAYPLEYKNKFKEIILPELIKNDKLKRYYDDWGSRCYFFAAEAYHTNLYPKGIKNLSSNTKKLKELGCDYIFSYDIIDFPEKANLRLLKVFNDSGFHYPLYLYLIND